MNIKQRKLLNCVKGKIEPQHTYYINTWHFPVQFALNTWSLRLHAFHASLTKWLSPDFEKKKQKKHWYLLSASIAIFIFIRLLMSCICVAVSVQSQNVITVTVFNT